MLVPLRGSVRGLSRQAQVLASDPARAAISAGRPILGRQDLHQKMQAALSVQSVVDQVPGAVGVLADLALPALRAAARPVEQLLGAAGDRADPSRQAQEARTARGAGV